MDQPASHMKLRKLMDEPEIELRYGAFNALRTLDPNDPFLGQVRVIDEPKREDDEEPSDSMAVAIATPRAARAPEDPFSLYVVDSEGPPLIHISRSRRSEIVVFGRDQRLLPPIVLDTGSIFLNAAQSDDKIELSKIVPSRYNDADVKTTTSLEVAEIIRKTANLGASYPQIVAILENAKRQRNLPANWLSMLFRSPIEFTWKPSSARTSPPSAMTRSSERRQKNRVQLAPLVFRDLRRNSDDSADDAKDNAASSATSSGTLIEIAICRACRNRRRVHRAIRATDRQRTALRHR